MAIEQGATNQFKLGMASGQFDFNTDTFKIALYTGAANLGPTTTAYTSVGETSGTGYTAGGVDLVVSVAPTVGADPTSTIVYLSFGDVLISPASFTARGALIYKVGGGNPSVCVLDFGSDKTATTIFNVQFPAANSASAIVRIT